LGFADFFDFAGFAFFQEFADAKNYLETVFEGKLYLFIDKRIIFFVGMASFAVSKDNCLYAKVFKL
jgi:hypothetical protein